MPGSFVSRKFPSLFSVSLLGVLVPRLDGVSGLFALSQT